MEVEGRSHVKLTVDSPRYEQARTAPASLKQPTLSALTAEYTEQASLNRKSVAMALQ